LKFSILIPHWREWRTTYYAITKLIEFKGKHEVDIVVIDNSAGDGSAANLDPLLKHITIVDYPKDRLQSHGVSFDYVLPAIKNEHIITIETDSHPTQDNWLDYYESLIEKGYDCAGSLLKLSGGEYVHPCGMYFKRSNWAEAMEFVKKIPYSYFPNMSWKQGFDCHLMVHESIFDGFVKSPDDYVELAKDYKPYTPMKATETLLHYEPVGKGVFHNGMGNRQESINTFHMRTVESESPTMHFDGKMKLINRIGAEPGQFFSWWHEYAGKKTFHIPTDIKWINGRENRQQEYTLMENGFTHIWAGSAYLSMKDTDMHDVYEFKKNQIEQLYKSIK
jgi:hypothetical protein